MSSAESAAHHYFEADALTGGWDCAEELELRVLFVVAGLYFACLGWE